MPKPTNARRLVLALHRARFPDPRIACIAHISPGYVRQILAGMREARRAPCDVRRAYWGYRHENQSADYSIMPQ